MPDTPTQTTDRELDDLAWRLCEAVFGSDVKCIPEYEPATEDFYAAAREADHWARDRYAASRELLRQHAEMTERMKELDAAHARAASLADRVMAAEGERDSYIALYVRVLQYAADTEDRLASLSDESAEAEAERYRLLYAQTLAKLEAAQGGERFESKPAAGVAWADWSKLRPGDEGWLPRAEGSVCGVMYPHVPNGQPVQCTRDADHEYGHHVAHGIDSDGNDYQIVAWRVQHD